MFENFVGAILLTVTLFLPSTASQDAAFVSNAPVMSSVGAGGALA